MKSLCSLFAVLLLASAAAAGPLQEAAAAGDLAKVRQLIQAAPAAISAREAGTTALHEATRAGHYDVVKLLVENGANVNATDFSGLTPLKLALGRRRVEIVDYLRKNGGLEQATQAPRAATMSPKIAVPPASQPPAPLFKSNPSPATPQVATPAPKVSLPAVPSTTASAPLPQPSAQDMLPVLVPIHDAARAGDVEQIKKLFATSPDLLEATDDKGMTPLHVAAEHKQLAAAQTLLALRAKVNVRSITGQTPLHVAARHADAVMVTLLLKHHAPIDALDNAGSTPLLVALQSANTEALRLAGDMAGAVSPMRGFAPQADMTQLLLRARAAVNTKNEAVVKALLQAGANPNVVESITGRAPLHFAASLGHAPTVQALVRHRGTVDAPDRRGETPLAYALREGRAEAIAALRAAGATTGQTRPLDATQQSLVNFYKQTEAALARANGPEKAKLIVALNPTKADCQRMFPKHADTAWKVVEQINGQIRQAFARPVTDAEAGREIWRITPEWPTRVTQEWRERNWLATDLPVFSLTVEKVGTTARPGDYCFVNGRWVLVPPLNTIAAQVAASAKR